MFGNNFNLDNRSMTSTYLTPTLAFTAFPTLFTMVQPVDPKGSRKARKMAESVVEGKGKWTAAEQRLYIAFLQHNMEDMRHKISRKSQKVFLQMSKQIPTRSADQCRSHHQKILKYHNSLEEIIKHYSEDIFSLEEKEEGGKGKPKESRTRLDEEGPAYTLTHQKHNNTFRIEINTELIDHF